VQRELTLWKEKISTVLKTFGGDEDYIWSPDSKSIFTLARKAGTDYAVSTNTTFRVQSRNRENYQ
jgi:hypothetical protein